MINRLRLILFSLLLFSAPTLFSQASAITHIYQITAEEAEALYRDEKTEPTETYFRDLVDTFSILPYTKILPNGHYLFAKAQQEIVDIQLRSYHSFGAIALNNNRDLAIQVLDSDGQQISNAELLFRDKKIPFDRATQTYRLRKWNKGGFLKIKYAGETQFYQVEPNSSEKLCTKKWQRFQQTKIGYVISTPVRWSKNTYQYFKRGLGWGNWRIYRFPFRQRAKPFKGYLALNKPKYRHGDTLQVKAYVTRQNGRPWTKPLELTISSNQGQQIFQKMLSPETPGAFLTQWVLGDSLPLDANYRLSIGHAKKDLLGQLNYSFRIEDYELDEVTFTLEANQEKYHQQEKITLMAEGKDQNGLNLADASIRLVLLPAKILDIHQSEVLIPDTLWQEHQTLKAGEPTQILIPDSIFPAVSLVVRVLATFTNSNGEIQDKNLTFTYLQKEEELVARIDSGHFIIDYFVNGKPAKGQGQLIRTSALEYTKHAPDTIDLPYQEKLRPEVMNYQVSTEQANINFNPQSKTNENAPIVTSRRQADSLFIEVQNPQHLNVVWNLSTAHRQLASGQFSDPVFYIQEEDRIPGPIYFQYQYLWGGKTHSKKLPIYQYKKLLNIEIDQVPKVLPGETIQVKLQVKDHENQPAKGVNMVAGAVNAQFGTTRSFTSPSVTYKKGKTPLEYPGFQLISNASANRVQTINHSWFKRLGLEQELFYQLRFSDQGIYLHYDTLAQDTFFREVAQFAPYLIKNHQAQPIYLIYCNRELVYYHDTDDQPPYSFVGRPGYNQITIRSRELEYTIDSVLLKAGQKLELSIDVDRYGQSSIPRVYQKAVSKSLNKAEQARIKNSLFLLKTQTSGPQYLWTTDQNIHTWLGNSNKQLFKVGPFPAGSSLNYVNQGGLETKFLFEPGYSYVLQENRERLYEHALFPENQPTLPYSLALKMPAEVIHTPAIIQKELPKALSIPFHKDRQTNKSGKGSYAFQYQSKLVSDFLIATVLVPKDSADIYRYYMPHSRQINQLPPGEYLFYCIKADSTIQQREILIRPDTMLFQNLEEMEFKKDSLLYHNLILKAYLKPVLYSANQRVPELPNPYINNGQRITGQVLDENGEPLIFANVKLVGTSLGTQTDFDGNYELWAPLGSYELEVSYLGYSSTRFVGSSHLQNNIVLESNQDLSEVVVVAYSIPLIEQDNTTVGVDQIRFRGSRALDTNYYLDGVRVEGQLLAEGKKDGDIFLDSFSENLSQSALNGIRSSFRDDAYWVPNLITDQNGEAYFTVTFPDDITSWQTFVLGQDKRLRAGTAFAKTQAYKPLMARLNLPRFLVAGDEVNIIGKSLNYSPDSVSIATSFSLGKKVIQQNQATIKDALIEHVTVRAPSEVDSLQMTYALTMGQYQDGEQRSIPLFPQGTMETIGNFYTLDGDTTFTFSTTPEYGPVTIYAQNNILEVLLEDLDELHEYPYGCMEQTASRLIALLLEKQVRNQLGEVFAYEKEIIPLVVRLKKFQNPNGSWGWWSEGQSINWISIHVIKALQMADQAGYRTESLENALRFLTSQINTLENQDLLPVLNRLSAAGQKLDYAKYLHPLDTLKFDLYDHLQMILIRQQQQLPYTLDSLDKYRQKTLFGGYFWGDEHFHLQRNQELTTLLAYQIYQFEKQETTCSQIRQFFLEQRAQRPICGRRWGWGNTYSTASILSTLLPDILKGQKDRNSLKSTLSLSGQTTQTTQSFPYQAQWSAGQNIQVQKTGAGPLFLTAYQQFQNPNPEPKAEDFVVQSQLYQEGHLVKKLEQGKPTTLQVELEVKVLTEYLMLEVPIPAGCSYGEKVLYSTYPETHREYFRQHTALFFKEIKPGKYTFTINLEPRFSGTFTLNPAQAEQMYFPVFYGRNEMKKVKILD